ncbi:MAG TPA: isocitrate lyase/PEP mutase family protein [Ktedonobacterales bacterium]
MTTSEGRATAGARLRELLARDEPVLAPGAFDALSARVVESAGFDAVYMTGFGTSAALLGQPDVGLLTQTEMVENAHHIVEAINIPLIADADTGYGNPLNVRRTVREYERAGIAAIHIEDQVSPKKCGHMDRKRVIPAEEMAAKIRAAIEARRDPDFLIIARTDARAVEGLEAALARAERYREAGADLLFVEAPQSLAEIEAIASRLRGAPLLYNWAEQGKTPPLAYDQLRGLGFQLIIFPITLLLTATQAMRAAAERLRAAGSPLPLLESLPTFQQFTDFIGLPEVKAMERRYGVEAWDAREEETR